MTEIAVRFRDVTLGYDRHPAVHHLNGKVERGALLAIVGPNGAGKSTLLRGIAGTLAPLSGAIALPGLKARDIAYLPQAADIDKSFPVNVFDLVAMGLWKQRGAFGAISRSDAARIETAIAAVGLEGFETRPIASLSGGQLQRMLFARLLMQDAALILLDEPFTAIDAKTAADLLAIVARWHGEHRTVLVVLHDFELVREHFPEALLLAREQIAMGETKTVLSAENLLKARAMIEAFDRHAQACARAA
jgi:zinc/manganese transport system ATP-binding protein